MAGQLTVNRGAESSLLFARHACWRDILFIICTGIVLCGSVSAQILSQNPTQFIASAEANVFVSVRNPGANGEFALRCVGVPSGWSVNNGAFIPSDFIYIGPLANNQNGVAGPFKVQVPASGGSGQMAWQLWRVSNFLGIINWESQVDFRAFNVQAPVGDTNAPVMATPAVTQSNENLRVSSIVTDGGSGVSTVTLHYNDRTVDPFGFFWGQRPMFPVGVDHYAAWIGQDHGDLPGVCGYGHTVYYYLTATDIAGNTSTSALYQVLVVSNGLFQVDITSSPSGTTVYWNGQLRGTTPVTLTQVSGSNNLRLAKSGYLDDVSSVVVAGNMTIARTLISVLDNELTVTCNESGAAVYLDSQFRGTTSGGFPPLFPSSLTIQSVPAGIRAVRVEKAGFITVNTNVMVAGQTTVHIQLESTIPPSRTVQISSSPSGAQVYWDSSMRGTTPLTLSNVSDGPHNLRLVAAGYVELTESVHISGNTNIHRVLNPAGYSLDIQCNENAAQVYLNGGYRGQTSQQGVGIPERPFTLRINDVPQGNHLVSVVKAGFPTHNTNLVVNSNLVIPVELDPLVFPLNVQSTPSGATVYLDNVYRGETPLAISDVTYGNHTIRLTKSGYADAGPAQIFVSGPITYSANLQSLSTYKLTIQTTEVGAQISVDGIIRGESTFLLFPTIGYGLEVSGLPAGLRDILITKQGFFDATASIHVAGDQTYFLALRPRPSFSEVMVSPQSGLFTFTINNATGTLVRTTDLMTGIREVVASNLTGNVSTTQNVSDIKAFYWVE